MFESSCKESLEKMRPYYQEKLEDLKEKIEMKRWFKKSDTQLFYQKYCYDYLKEWNALKEDSHPEIPKGFEVILKLLAERDTALLERKKQDIDSKPSSLQLLISWIVENKGTFVITPDGLFSAHIEDRNFRGETKTTYDIFQEALEYFKTQRKDEMTSEDDEAMGV